MSIMLCVIELCSVIGCEFLHSMRICNVSVCIPCLEYQIYFILFYLVGQAIGDTTSFYHSNYGVDKCANTALAPDSVSSPCILCGHQLHWHLIILASYFVHKFIFVSDLSAVLAAFHLLLFLFFIIIFCCIQCIWL